MKVWKVILATFVIFCAGVFAGVQIVELRHARIRASLAETWTPPKPLGFSTNGPHGTNRGPLAMPFGGRPPFRNLSKDFLERLDRELNLTPDQRKQIEKILDESQKHTKEVWKKIEPEMREEMKKSRDQIRESLTPEQTARFEELMKRHKAPKDGQTNNAAPRPSTNPAPAAPSAPPAP